LGVGVECDLVAVSTVAMKISAIMGVHRRCVRVAI
jgi:hypothetical protein